MLPKPKKSLGQNFLVDHNIRRKMVSASGLDSSKVVLEIGSGKGEMTGLLAKEAKKVYALELDKELLGYLKEAAKQCPGIIPVHKDILKFNIARHFRALTEEVIVFGNIPYYISTPIIIRLIKYRNLIPKAFLTVQKEFAERVCSAPGTKRYGSLSCFAQYYFKPRILFTIPRSCFFPRPKVDSAFLCLERREELPLKKTQEELLFKIIRTSFNQRRKTLSNSLKGLIPGERLENCLKIRGLSAQIRPERLSLEDFCFLASCLNKEKT